MRQYVKIKKTKFNRGQRKSGEDAIKSALSTARIEAVVDYDKRNDTFLIQAPGATAAIVSAAIPATFRGDIVVDSSPFPIPEQAYTTGATTGKAAYAGYDLFPSCSLAFPVTYSFGGQNNRQGILSAGHCFEQFDADKYLDWGGGVRTTFESAVWKLSKDSIDVAFLDTTGMTTGYWLNYYNPGGKTGGFASPQGWLRTKNFIRQSASWIGMYVCKQGNTTDLTCGEVVSLSWPYTYFGPNGRFVKVSKSKQANISAGGDSGGPWFTSTVVSTTTEVSALGLHVTGDGSGVRRQII